MKKSLLIIFGIFLVIACSTKKSGFVNKNYHKLTTWNNTLFNGEMALQKILKSKTESHQDDYFSIISVEPIDYFPNEEEEGAVSAPINSGSFFKNTASSSQDSEPQSEFGTPLAKSLKAIEKHSMLIKGTEYNSMMTRAYLMLGKAKLYEGKYFEAIDAFSYIDKNIIKDKHKIANKIYMAEAQEQLGNVYDAKLIYEDLTQTKLKKKYKNLLAQKYSQFLINTQDYELASEALEVAVKSAKKKKEKGRYRFVQGQLAQALGDTEKAKEYYAKAYKKKPGFDMEVKSQMALASLFDKENDDFTATENKLKKLLKKGTYKAQKNEIYYALGNLSAQVDSTNRAENYYLEALKNPESDMQVRAHTYLNVGDLKFKKSEYLTATKYYDSAITMIQKPELLEAVTQKNKSLKGVADNYYIVQKNDSILALAKMSKTEQDNFFNDFIEKLKEKEALLAIEEETQFALDNNKNTFSLENKGKFYFYNEGQKSKGIQDFKQRWGSRNLSNNWRVSSLANNQNNQSTTEEESLDLNNPRRFDLDFYTDQIPTSSKEIEGLKLERDSAELKLGTLYYDPLQDSNLSSKTLQHLISTPPKEEEITVLAYYNLYLANKDLENSIAQESKNYLTQNYPNSKYTQYILNPNVDYFTEKSKESIAFYEGTYAEYEAGNFNQVILKSREALEKFPQDQIIAKFALLSALSEAKLGNTQEYKEALGRIIILFENTPEAQKAQELLDATN